MRTLSKVSRREDAVGPADAWSGQETTGRHRPGAKEWSLRDIILVLCKRRWTIYAFFLATVTTVLVGGMISGPTYEASAALLVKKARTEMPLLPTEQSDPIVVEVSEEDLNSEIEVLRSRTLTRGVLEDLGLSEAEEVTTLRRVKDGLKAVLGMPVLSADDQQLLSLEDALSFQALARSNIIELRYESDEPDLAARVLGSLIEHYMDYRVQVHQSLRAADFFDDERDKADARLRAAEAAAAQYVREEGISLAHETQQEVALQRLDQFERLLAESSVEVQELESRYATLQERLGEEPERLETAYRLNSVSETEEIRTRLVDLRSRRDDLRTRGYTDTNARVADLTVQIRLAEERLAEAEARAGAIDGTEINPIYQSLRNQFLTVEADLVGARAGYVTLEQQVARFRAQLADMNDQTYEVNRLLRDAESAEELYLLYARRAEEARVSSAIDGERRVNVTVARAPERPLTPAGPSRALLLAATLLLGGVGGLGMAFTREMLDRSFTTGDDLERVLGIRHLASVPEAPGPERAAAGDAQGDHADSPEDQPTSRWSWVRSGLGRGRAPAGASARSEANRMAERRSREAYQRVAHELMSLPGAEAKVVLVAGAVEGEGASTVAGQVAVALAGARRGRVLLVDVEGGDQGESAASRVLEVKAEAEGGEAPGTSVEPIPAGSALFPHRWEAGAPFPLVTGAALRNALAELTRGFDWVVVDGLPLTRFPETAALSTEADATVLVLRAESTREEVARRAVNILRESGGDVVGGVLNRRRYHIPQFVYARL